MFIFKQKSLWRALRNLSYDGGDGMAMSWRDHLRYEEPAVIVKQVDFLVISKVRILSMFST